MAVGACGTWNAANQFRKEGDQLFLRLVPLAVLQRKALPSCPRGQQQGQLSWRQVQLGWGQSQVMESLSQHILKVCCLPLPSMKEQQQQQQKPGELLEVNPPTQGRGPFGTCVF